MCTYGDKKIKPKYVVSTATIKNASEQTRCLYARKSTAQFPPNGFEIGDSFSSMKYPLKMTHSESMLEYAHQVNP